MSETHSSIGPVESTLRGIRDLLSDEKRWTKGWFAKDAIGMKADSRDDSAICWCWAGACRRVIAAPNDYHLQVAVFDALRNGAGVGDDITQWNDRPGRTHAEVLAATDRAISYAHERGL